MAIINLSRYWRRLVDDPADAPAHNDGRRAVPAWLQADIDDGVIRSTRTTPGYEGRHRADRRCACGQMDCQGHGLSRTGAAHSSGYRVERPPSPTYRFTVVEQPGGAS